MRFETAATTSMSSSRAPRDVDLAAGDRRDHRPAARLDVVAPRAVLGAAQRRAALDADRRRADAGDADAHLRRNSHSSTTCGSHAAWRISETPGAAAAASSAVSVPVTDASYRYIDVGFRPSGASSTWPGRRARRAPIASSASRCVEIVRRAGKSPPGGARRARPRRASSGPSSSTEPRSRPTSARVGLVARHLRRTDAQRRRADAVDLGAEVRAAAAPSPRRRRSAARWSARTRRRSAGTRPAAAAPRSCCLRPSTGPRAGGRPQSAVSTSANAGRCRDRDSGWGRDLRIAAFRARPRIRGSRRCRSVATPQDHDLFA